MPAQLIEGLELESISGQESDEGVLYYNINEPHYQASVESITVQMEAGPNGPIPWARIELVFLGEPNAEYITRLVNLSLMEQIAIKSNSL